MIFSPKGADIAFRIASCRISTGRFGFVIISFASPCIHKVEKSVAKKVTVDVQCGVEEWRQYCRIPTVGNIVVYCGSG